MISVVLAALCAALGTWALTALGAATVVLFKSTNEKVLNLMLGFAAGAMLFVSVRELIPEACCADDCYLGTLSVLLGFTVMMILDIALG